ncbi:MAG TPA: hypothetical protein VKB03_07325 [Conexibacter sp.]|nr:hypothetical protein [Conexibacter sp.]
MLTLLAVVVEHSSDEGSKTAFYVAAGALACWAVLLGAFGVMRPAFPRGNGPARAVMLVSGLLMVTTMACAVITAS